MKAVSALRVPLNTDLGPFVALLRTWQVPHRVSEEAGEQVLWVPDESLAEQVRAAYRRFEREGLPDDLELLAPPKPKGSAIAQLRQSPYTCALLLVTFIVAAITLLGDNLTAVAWLSFNDFHADGAYAYFVPVEHSFAQGQWWRLITPMFVHFGLLHLAMNSLWIWELGRRVEARQRGLGLIGLVLLFALISNTAQYLYSGPSIFGGLSGVLYGLLGHCWLFGRIAPCAAYQLPRGVVAMMLIWLVVCMTGVFEALGIGAIANAAHLSGLVMGCLTGSLMGLLARRV